MHEVAETTEQMVRSVLAYANNRLLTNTVPPRQGRAACRPAVRTPRWADRRSAAAARRRARRVHRGHRAERDRAGQSGVSRFIPSATTKAGPLFDMLVSCVSIQGISWLEASGAIAAENRVPPRGVKDGPNLLEDPN
jgi:aromatic-L-amino-acid decarboxylase